MKPIIDALWMGMTSLTRIIFHPIFWVVLFLVYTQYKKQTPREIKMLGSAKRSALVKTANSTFHGLVGGLLGSILMIIIGVSIRQEGLKYLWPIALILFMINARYLCFSYAGGLLSLFSLIFGFPQIDVPGLMALVAILHFVESILIYTNGSEDSLPIILDRGDGKHIGGYSLHRFWPIPIIIMTIMISNQIPSPGQIQMPDWWPIIKPMGELQFREDLIFLILTVVAALGYGDIALTQPPKVKVKKSAIKLGAYSVILLILSILSSRVYEVQWIAAFFAPAAHEFLIWQGRKEEQEGVPLFTIPQRGLRVLEVLEGSAAHKMGIQRGDIIHSINNFPINCEEDILQLLSQFPTFVWVKGEDYKGEGYTKELKAYPYGLRALGVLPLPQYSEIVYTAKEKESIMKRLWNKIKNKNNR